MAMLTTICLNYLLPFSIFALSVTYVVGRATSALIRLYTWFRPRLPIAGEVWENETLGQVYICEYQMNSIRYSTLRSQRGGTYNDSVSDFLSAGMKPVKLHDVEWPSGDEK